MQPALDTVCTPGWNEKQLQKSEIPACWSHPMMGILGHGVGAAPTQALRGWALRMSHAVKEASVEGHGRVS